MLDSEGEYEDVPYYVEAEWCFIIRRFSKSIQFVLEWEKIKEGLLNGNPLLLEFETVENLVNLNLVGDCELDSVY